MTLALNNPYAIEQRNQTKSNQLDKVFIYLKYLWRYIIGDQIIQMTLAQNNHTRFDMP